MKPISLTLKNFMAYTDQEVDLSDITKAALVGENGSGKSSLIDAMTVALYGKGRGGSVDDYVRRGETEMSVEFVFELRGTRYRVVRTRGLQGRGKSSLEFAREEGGQWLPLTRDSIRETQQLIEETLGVDYDTLTAASFVLQGRADEFTRKPPGERKAVLAAALGLELWDRLQEAAKERLRGYQQNAEVCRQELDGISEQLSRRPELEAQAADIRRGIGELEKAVEAAEMSRRQAAHDVSAFEMKAAGLEDLRGRCAGLRHELDELDRDIAALGPKRERAQKILGRRDEIMRACDAEPRLKTELDALEAKADQERELRERLAEAKAALANWQREHESRRARAESALENARAKAALLEEVDCDRRDCRFLVDAFEARDSLERLTAELQVIRAEALPDAAREIRGVEAELGRLLYDPDQRRRLKEKLDAVAKWTRLRPELDQAEQTLRELDEQEKRLQQARGSKVQDLRELTRRLEELEDIGSRLGAARRRLEETEAELKRVQADLSGAQRELGQVEGQLSSLEALEKRRTKFETDLKVAEREVHLYQSLARRVFSRNGVPALLIEHAIPQIEADANDLLGRMTGGRLSVQLVTQRETKSGTISETLDIIITDELGERPYDMWSGAERWEVDISLRLAISRLMARRAGFPFETLIIDEGFGSLDEQTRARFGEVVEAIARDFSVLIVISHLYEIARFFPQSIGVTKTPWGSKVRVAA